MNKVKVAFVNPPHADWCLANFSSLMMFSSHYKRHGKYPNLIEWMTPPHKYDKYTNIEEIYNDIVGADIVLFSSYVWNYDICDDLAKLVKQRQPNTICVVGGPHIGSNEPEFLKTRTCYDLFLRATKPGEIFVEELLNEYIDNNGVVDFKNLSWELRSDKTCSQFMPDYSIYKDHIDLLKLMRNYARDNNLEPFMIIETTRGCPYQCAYCEWGGGIGSKIYKKPIEVVKEDILTLKETGFRDVYLTDANFGAFYDRDLEIFKFAWDNRVNLTDISTMKTKDLKRRTDLVDAWFSVVGSGPETHSLVNTKKEAGHILVSGAAEMAELSDTPLYISVVPTVSIQSISDEAMRVAKRTDLKFEDKIALSKHIYERCHKEGFPVPALELILGMPGSTIDDFYDEMTIIYNFKSWGSHRHDYMFLPDSDLSKPVYLEINDIKLVTVYTDLVDEEGVDNQNSLYKTKRHYFKTISSCFSFTHLEMVEMWIMNICGNYVLKYWYDPLNEYLTPPEFCKLVYKSLMEIDEFKDIHDEVYDLLNHNTPPKNSKRLQGRLRNVVLENFLEKYELLLKNMIYSEVLV